MFETASVNWPRLANEQSPKHRVGASNMPLSELQAASYALPSSFRNPLDLDFLRAFLDVANLFSEKIPLDAAIACGGRVICRQIPLEKTEQSQTREITESCKPAPPRSKPWIPGLLTISQRFLPQQTLLRRNVVDHRFLVSNAGDARFAAIVRSRATNASSPTPPAARMRRFTSRPGEPRSWI